MDNAGKDRLAAHRALSLWTRVEILTALRQSEHPLSAAELAQLTGLHVNTVRFHLQVLAEASLAVTAPEHSSRRGRPRRVWSSTGPDVPTSAESYKMLARVLVDYVARQSSSPGDVGERLGSTWGTDLARAGGLGRAGGVEQVVAMMADLGFSPTLVTGRGELILQLRSCPFLELAEHNQKVVCSAHLGLLRGALTEIGVPLKAERLDPLVEPSLCVAHLRRARRSVKSASA